MYKKIILSTVAIATLSIGAFAADQARVNELFNKYLSNTENIVKGYLVNNDQVCIQGNRSNMIFNMDKITDAKAMEGALEYKFGTASNSILKNYAGKALTVNIGWSQIAQNYNEFTCLLSNKDKLKLVFFLHARALDEMSNASQTMSKEKSIRINRIQMVWDMYDTVENNNNRSGNKNAFSLIDSGAFIRLAVNWDGTNFTKEDRAENDINFKKFFSAITKRDYVTAKQIVLNDQRTNYELQALMDYFEAGKFN